ncbi:MAG: IPTL-CTERM sorting domain-containing protein, partial [Candidatus Wenzhouxiangella sp. M2_3B_020]
DTFDFTVSCDSSTETTYTRTIDFSWDDPAGSGTASVNVECTISDTAPIYESDPTPGSTISLSAQFGTQAGPDGVDVRNANTNNAADDLIINSATADDPIFNVSVVNSTFSPNGSFDGSNDVQVTCTPQGVGTVSGTLTVDTNDPNQSGGGFTYPLNCIGTGSVITSTPAAGGTLNLGSVAPGSASPTQPIEFTNNHISDSYSVSCSVSDPDGVFDWTPDPIQFTVSPGQTESVFFQGTPPDIATYSATVDCTGNVTRGSAFSAQYTVTVTGRPLVIPTLNHWGLLLMSLIVLALGGLAGRRLMA